jgi:uncharacterized DUF497 family protein
MNEVERSDRPADRIVIVEYGRAKHQLCVAERGFGFDFAARIWLGETIDVDVSRAEDGEPRFRTIGIIEGVAFAVVWTPRNDSRRILSARRASRKERKSL